MLSFMREQDSSRASDRPSAGADPQNAGAGEGPEAQEFLTVAANRQSLRRSTMLVAILVGIGLVCLLVMIRRSQPQAASAAANPGDQTKIEAAISRLTGVRSEMVDRADEIVKKFYEFSDVTQVRVGELAKNPFEVEGFVKNNKTPVPAENESQAEFLRRQRLQQQASTLKLLSIMRSEQGGTSCMINDQILRQGDAIGGFLITKIGTNLVELAWPTNGGSGPGMPQTEETKITLKLSE